MVNRRGSTLDVNKHKLPQGKDDEATPLLDRAMAIMENASEESDDYVADTRDCSKVA